MAHAGVGCRGHLWGGQQWPHGCGYSATGYSPHDSITHILEKPFICFCGYKHQFVDRAREYLGVENKVGKPASEIGQLSKERVKAEINRQAVIVWPFIQIETDRWAPDAPVG